MAPTRNTIATAEPSPVRPGPIVPAVLALLLGGLLLWLGLPRALAALEAISALGAQQAVAEGRTPAPAELADAVTAARRAAGLRDDATHWSRLASLLQAQAMAPDAGATRPALLEEAAVAQRRAVRQSPAEPFQWLRVAELEVLRHGVTPAAGRAVGMAFRRAPATRVLLLERLDLGLLAWPVLQPEARQLVDRSIRLAAAGRDMAGLVELARRRYALGPVRRALAGDAGLLAAFDAAYLAGPAAR